jgi:hypothetical protein
MPAGTPNALTIVRVARGQPAPSPEALRVALEGDLARLHLPVEPTRRDVAVAGPYQILIDGQELDEYVVWER